ncbi:MAG: hotdog fold thioesterase [Hyphomicrobiaceae bacterium]
MAAAEQGRGTGEAGGLASPLAVMRWMASVNPIFKMLEIEIVEVGTASSRLVMPVTPAVSNTYGVAHGGMVFAFADLCFGFTSNAVTNQKGLSSSAEIHWTASGVVGDRLVGDTVEAWRKGRNGLYDVRIASERTGELVALVHGRIRFIGGEVIDPVTGMPPA